MLNTENFLEVLKFLSAYNVTICDYLQKLCKKHEDFPEEMTRTGGRPGIIDFIEKEITCEIVKRIHNCKAWAFIADTTPDSSYHETFSTCVRIVDRVGYCSEHLLCSQRAPGATAKGAILFQCPDNPVTSWLSPCRCRYHTLRKCSFNSLSILLQPSAHAQHLRKLKLDFGQPCCKEVWRLYFLWARNFTAGQRRHNWHVSNNIKGTYKSTFIKWNFLALLL